MADHLVTRLTRLRARVVWHKAELKRHRRELQADSAELEQVERECQRQGIGPVALPGGAGANHGHPST